MDKQLFHMSAEQLALMTLPSRTQEEMDRAWKALGEEMGFIWKTASAAPATEEFGFMAIPIAQADAYDHWMFGSHYPRGRYQGD